jgi:hypothetical protein
MGQGICLLLAAVLLMISASTSLIQFAGKQIIRNILRGFWSESYSFTHHWILSVQRRFVKLVYVPGYVYNSTLWPVLHYQIKEITDHGTDNYSCYHLFIVV